MASRKARDKRKMIEALAECRLVILAVKQVGISRATYYRWRDEDPVFAADADNSIQIGKQKLYETAEGVVMKKLQAEDTRAAIFVLRRLHPDYKDPPKNIVQVDNYAWSGLADMLLAAREVNRKAREKDDH